jgi:hypothetical protein
MVSQGDADAMVSGYSPLSIGCKTINATIGKSTRISLIATTNSDDDQSWSNVLSDTELIQIQQMI